MITDDLKRNFLLFFAVAVSLIFLWRPANAQEVMFSATMGPNLSFQILRLGKVFWGEIRDAKQSVATCALKIWEKDDVTGTRTLDMSCKSPSGIPLTASASLVWKRLGARTLRFGSWLGGYQEMPLSVEVDQYPLPNTLETRPVVRVSRLSTH